MRRSRRRGEEGGRGKRWVGRGKEKRGSESKWGNSECEREKWRRCGGR